MKTVMLVLAVAALITSGAAGAQTEEGVLEHYAGSSDVPDSVVFGLFLARVQSRKEASDDLPVVAEAFGYRLDDPSGQERAKARIAALEKTYAALEKEKKTAVNAALCSESPASRGVDELFYASNAVDDVENNAEEKYLLIVLSSLTTDERNAFLAYLDDRKQSTSHTRIDNRTLYGPGQESLIRTDIGRYCVELESAITQMGAQQ